MPSSPPSCPSGDLSSTRFGSGTTPCWRSPGTVKTSKKSSVSLFLFLYRNLRFAADRPEYHGSRVKEDPVTGEVC